MTTLVDGHNALHRLRIRTGDHERDRRELLQRVREIEAQAEVFFDARNAPAGLPPKSREEGVTVHYCREDEADRAILDRVRDAARPSRLIVVSDDQEVAGGARHLGARILSVVAFFSPPSPPEPDDLKEIGPAGFSPDDFGLPDRVNLKHPPRELR